MSTDGSGFFLAIVIAIFLFHGDPDIADAILKLLLKLAQ